MFFTNYQQLEANAQYKVSKFQNEASQNRRARRAQKEPGQAPLYHEQFLREILARVKHGEISVEEGLQHLRQI
jgi:hypothetical protein